MYRLIFILVLSSCSIAVNSAAVETVLCDYAKVLPPPQSQTLAELENKFHALLKKDPTSFESPYMIELLNKIRLLSDERNSSWRNQPTVSDFLLGKDIDDCHDYILQELRKRNIPDDEVDSFLEALYADNNIDQDAKYRCRCPRNGNHVDKIKE